MHRPRPSPPRGEPSTSRDGRDGDVVVVVEAKPDADLEKLPAKVRTAVADAVGLTPREVFVVAKDTLPKTTSGKLQRLAVRTSYADGSLHSAVIAASP